MKNIRLCTTSLIVLLILSTICSFSESRLQICKPSSKIKAKKPPNGHCNIEEDDICCIKDKIYTTYKCSPQVSSKTKAILTLNSFKKGGDGDGDGDGPSKCDNKYHSDDTHVIALSTGWYNGGGRCLRNITINGNGRSINAMVVDECDSTMSCDEKHDYQPPCQNNLVIASQGVWRALRVPINEWGELDITWFDE